jgi:hypothetical protein
VPFDAGVPESEAVPSPLSTNVTPDGRVPFSLRLGVGVPVEATVNELAEPNVKVVPLAEVTDGAWLTVVTVRTKDWLAFAPTPLLAVIVIGKVPPEVGVPERVAVPLPLSTKLTPIGSEPVSDTAAVGKPDVVTSKLLETPSAKVVPADDVTAGAWSTTRVKDWLPLGLTPFAALTVIG